MHNNMLKVFFVTLVLVHATLQLEVANNEQKNGDGQIEAKKYYKKEHKKYENENYNSKESYKNEKNKKYNSDLHSEKWNKDKKEWKESDWANKKEGKEKFKREKRNKEHNADHNELRHGRENYQLATANEKDLGRDIQVNEKAKPSNHPDVELIEFKRRFYENMPKLDLTEPPNPNNTIMMARFIVHAVDWAALATVNKRSNAKNGPFSNVVSISDGPVEQGSGVPFFYLTPMDLSSQDLQKENKASITMTLAQTDYCRKQSFDPEDPRCARVIFTGKVKRVQPETLEEEFAKKALFSRHPSMQNWPKDHKFFLAKFKIAEIILLDQFGGPKYLDVEDYLKPPQ